MTRANIYCGLGTIAVGGGMYLLHPALTCLWIGGVMIGIGTLLYIKEAKKGNPK